MHFIFWIIYHKGYITIISWTLFNGERNKSKCDTWPFGTKEDQGKENKSVKISQLHFSLEGCDILKRLEELEITKEEKIEKKYAKAQSLINLRKKFEECKDVCLCTGGECLVEDYKQAPV